MLSLVVRRVVRLVVVLAGVSLVTFAILQVSGDPVALMMPEAPEADRAAALPLVLARMPTTLLLTVLAISLSLLIALPLGVLSAVRRNSIFDHGATLAVFLGTSMPVFWTGIMLILLFAVQFRWLPVSGWESWGALVLPALTLASFSTPLLLRIVRSSMLEVVNLDYVRTARAKGVSERFVIWRHALVNAALPL